MLGLRDHLLAYLTKTRDQIKKGPVGWDHLHQNAVLVDADTLAYVVDASSMHASHVE